MKRISQRFSKDRPKKDSSESINPQFDNSDDHTSVDVSLRSPAPHKRRSRSGNPRFSGESASPTDDPSNTSSRVRRPSLSLRRGRSAKHISDDSLTSGGSSVVEDLFEENSLLDATPVVDPQPPPVRTRTDSVTSTFVKGKLGKVGKMITGKLRLSSRSMRSSVASESEMPASPPPPQAKNAQLKTKLKQQEVLKASAAKPRDRSVDSAASRTKLKLKNARVKLGKAKPKQKKKTKKEKTTKSKLSKRTQKRISAKRSKKYPYPGDVSLRYLSPKPEPIPFFGRPETGVDFGDGARLIQVAIR